jgi:hypothetical protein
VCADRGIAPGKALVCARQRPPQFPLHPYKLPQLQERRTALERDLTEVKRQVGSFLSKLVDLEGSEALGPVKEKLEDLTRQRTGFESGLEELDSTIASVKGKAVNQEVVLAALSRFKDIYAKLPPYQRRELIGLVLLKAEVTESQLRLSFHGRPAAPEVFEKISAPGARAPRRAEPFEWLPGLTSQSAVVRDYRALEVGRRRANRLVLTVAG